MNTLIKYFWVFLLIVFVVYWFWVARESAAKIIKKANKSFTISFIETVITDNKCCNIRALKIAKRELCAYLFQR